MTKFVPHPKPNAVAAASGQLPNDPPPVTLQRRTWSPTLFVYALQELILPLCACLAGFMMLFLLADTFDVLQDFLQANSPWMTMLHYFALKQPGNLVHILPMSVLLACSFAVTRLNTRHELTAIRASGISMPRFFLPAWLIAIITAVCLLLLSEWLAPRSTRQAEHLLQSLDNPSAAAASQAQVARLAFRNAEGTRNWFFQSFSRTGQQHGVMIKQFRADHSVEWELRAAESRYHNNTWVFNDVTISHYDARGALPEGPPEVYDQYQVSTFTETPGSILNSLRPADELSVAAMLRLLQTHQRLPASTKNVFRTTIWYRLFHPLSCLLAALLGVGLNLNNQRSGALKGFATALAVLIAYYMTAQLFVLLGKNGILPAVAAGTLPVLLFNGWGIWELNRRR